MGYSKKDAIAKLNRERREAKAAKRRKVAVRKRIVRRRHKGYEEYWYEKGDADFYHILATIGNEQLAKDRARKLSEQYTDMNYAAHNPCTKVYLLIEELEKYQ